MADFDENIRKCAVCGEEVGPRFRFCPACGSSVAAKPFQPTLPSAPPEETGEEAVSPPPDAEGRRVTGNIPPRQVRIRTNADSAEIRFREFSAVARKRRRHDDRKSVIPLILALMVFLASIGGGVYWFFRQAEELPWDSVVVERPVAEEKKESFAESPSKGEPEPASQGSESEPIPPPAGEKEIAAIPAGQAVPASAPKKSAGETFAISGPARGVVIGSGVNLRGSSTIESPVVGKVSAGKKAEVLESVIPDDSAEAVTLSDVELLSPDGKKVKIARGRGVTVTGAPDASGMVTVNLPGDKNKTAYRVSSKALSDPHAWPWYRIKPEGGREGWIFGKFLTILDPRDDSLSALLLDNMLASFGTTREQIQGMLGKPSGTSSKKANTPSGEGTEVTMNFKGASVVLLEGPGGNEVKKITLSSPEHSLYGGLRPGADKRQVLSLLGHPGALSGSTEIYKADKISGIRIVYENYKVKTVSAGVLD